MKTETLYIRLKKGEIVKDGDFITAKQGKQPKFGKINVKSLFGMVKVDKFGEIHINHIINGNEACYAYRPKIVEIKPKMPKIKVEPAEKQKKEIVWNGKTYKIPDGYRQLNVGEKLQKGDGFLNTDNNIIYYLHSNNLEKICIKQSDFFPSIRLIANDNIKQVKQVEEKKVEIPAKVNNFEVGDIFVSKNGSSTVLIIPACYKKTRFLLAGLNGLEIFTNFYLKNGATKEEILDYLNQNKYFFVTNINDKVKKSIELANIKAGKI